VSCQYCRASQGQSCLFTSNVVDALKNHEVFYTGLVNGVALVAGEERRAKTAAEDGVAACSLVVDGNGGVVCGLEAGKEEVGPAMWRSAEDFPGDERDP
jgi:hypothetical protein